MAEILYVAIGGFFGAILRYAISNLLRRKNGFPLGTLVVNLLGAFLLGLLAGLGIHGSQYTLLGVGFMGAFTTFSTFMLESEQLKKTGKNKFFYVYMACSLLLGIGLLSFGLFIGSIM